MFKEFKPSILFLVKFVGTYLVLNLLYGFYIESRHPRPDEATALVTRHTSFALSLLGEENTATESPTRPNVTLADGHREVIAVYEGCNGLNIIIIFLAFVLAFGKPGKKLLWFIPMGVAIIYLLNIARIATLFYVSKYMEQYLYFTHKYLFTAILFGGVFFLWYWWVRYLYVRPRHG